MAKEILNPLIGSGVFVVIVGFLFFRFYSNVALKRKLFPLYIIVMAVAISVFVWFAVAALPAKLATIVMVILAAWLNIKTVGFCQQCANPVYYNAKVKKCPKCGADIKKG